MKTHDLVLCKSADGWSLHEPGSTDDAIADGDAPCILSGPGTPTQADFDTAADLLGTASRPGP